MPVTIGLMVTILISTVTGFKHPGIYRKMVHHPNVMLNDRSYQRLITSDLVHNDVVHLLVNEGMAYYICGSLEEMLNGKSPHGSMEFMFIYAASHFSGILFTTIRHRNHFEYSSAGASGSILGCMMSYMILDPDYIAFYLPVFGGIRNIFAGLIVIAGLIVYQWRTKNEMMDHELHFYSAIGGIAGTLILFPHIV